MWRLLANLERLTLTRVRPGEAPPLRLGRSLPNLRSLTLRDHDKASILGDMLVVMGEFSRTPRMNDGGNGGPPMSMGTPGRDHWGNAISVLMAGGGIRGGQIVGSTNRLGEAPHDHPLRPGDIHHTIFHVLGVDPNLTFNDHSGRPIAAIDHGSVIDELV